MVYAQTRVHPWKLIFSGILRYKRITKSRPNLFIPLICPDGVKWYFDLPDRRPKLPWYERQSKYLSTGQFSIALSNNKQLALSWTGIVSNDLRLLTILNANLYGSNSGILLWIYEAQTSSKNPISVAWIS